MESMNIPRAISARSVPCDLCASNDFEIVSHLDRRQKPLTTVICRTCGLVSHEDIPSDLELAQYYAEEYRSDYHGEYTPSPHRVVRAQRVGQLLLQDLLDDLNPDDHVFEIGAGIGGTVRAFQDAGFTASGIEPGKGFCDYARRKMGVDIQQQSLADVEPTPSYDLALLVHVIEHLRSPRQAIRHIRSILRRGGLLYVECPDLAQTHAAPNRLFHYAHIYNFVPSSLQALCESCGFRLVRSIKTKAKVIRHLYQAIDDTPLNIRDDAYQSAIIGIFRYNALTYHLRGQYFTDRFRRATELLATRMFPRWRLQVAAQVVAERL